MANYYMGYASQKSGNQKKALKYYKIANSMTSDYCFPTRIKSIDVLNKAIELDQNASKACYYLGNLLYDKFRYEEAIALWEKSVELEDGFYIPHRNLSIAYFSTAKHHGLAKNKMEKAFGLSGDSRMLFELQQLYKRMGVQPNLQLKLLEDNMELVFKRDDCYLEMLYLYTLVGNYEKTVEMLKSRTFNVYEGGEGKLTKHHGWLYTTLGNLLLNEGKADEAIEKYVQALIFPKNYGEGRAYLAQEAHIYYFQGKAHEKNNMPKKAKEAYEQAAAFRPDINEISYFEALGLLKLNRNKEAIGIFEKMIVQGNIFIEQASIPAYFGVGQPIPEVFDGDIQRINTIKGLLIKWMGYKGLGKTEEESMTYQALMKIDPNNMKVFFINKNIQFA